MTEFKITIEATALTEAINNLAAAIGSAGRTAEAAPATVSAPKKRTKAPAPAPVEPVATASAPVNPAVPVAPAPAAPTTGAFVPGAPQATPVTAVPANAQPFTPGVPSAPVVPAAPAAPAGYTLSQLSNAGAALVEQGKMNELMALLARYGVSAITQIPPAQYPATIAETPSYSKGARNLQVSDATGRTTVFDVTAPDVTDMTATAVLPAGVYTFTMNIFNVRGGQSGVSYAYPTVTYTITFS